MLQHGDTTFPEPMWVFTPKPEIIYGASCIVLDPSHHFNKPEYHKVSFLPLFRGNPWLSWHSIFGPSFRYDLHFGGYSVIHIFAVGHQAE